MSGKITVPQIFQEEEKKEERKKEYGKKSAEEMKESEFEKAKETREASEGSEAEEEGEPGEAEETRESSEAEGESESVEASGSGKERSEPGEAGESGGAEEEGESGGAEEESGESGTEKSSELREAEEEGESSEAMETSSETGKDSEATASKSSAEAVEAEETVEASEGSEGSEAGEVGEKGEPGEVEEAEEYGEATEDGEVEESKEYGEAEDYGESSEAEEESELSSEETEYQPHTSEYNVEQVVDVTQTEETAVKYYQTEFYRFLERFAEEETKIVDLSGYDKWYIRKLMLRKYERKPLKSYRCSRVKDKAVLVLDNSGSMQWWTYNLQILAHLALQRNDVEIYIAPNGNIQGLLTRKGVIRVEHEKIMKMLKCRRIIYVGDFDGANTAVELSWSNDVIWICPEERYRRFSAHDWVHYSESDFKGVFIRVYDLDEMFSVLKRITRYYRLWIDLHEKDEFWDDSVE